MTTGSRCLGRNSGRKSLLIVNYLMLVLGLTIILTNYTQAEQPSETEMRQVCRNWLAQSVIDRGSWDKSAAPEIVAENGIFDGDRLLAKYYTISPNGFVLVPALKEMRPIKAYSESYVLDEKQEGGFLQLIREILSERMNLYIAKYGSLDATQSPGDEPLFAVSQRQLWDIYTLETADFLSTRSFDKSTMEEAGPLLTSSWHQRSPYNDLCPWGDGGRTVVGCVATATSQILNYWQWPPSGVGEHTYTWAGDNSCDGDTPAQDLYADYSDTYDWAHIIDSCDDGCLPSDSAALAELCYETGVAFNMDYGACGSGANTASAVMVFPTYFKYSLEAKKEDRTDYDLPGWYNLIKSEIDQNRPMQYRINMHSIVCDGYRDNSGQYEYHMNYGWGGSFTTWFVLDSLYCYWIEPDSVCPASEEFLMTHIYPQDQPILSFSSKTTVESGNGNGICEPGEAFQMAVTISNMGWDATNTTGQLTTSDPYLSITSPSVLFDAMIPWGDQSESQSPFGISISPSCPDPYIATFILTLLADGGYSSSDTIFIYIGTTPGLADDFELGSDFWRHDQFQPTFLDEWHLDTYRAHSGTSSWKVGGIGPEDYSDGLDAALMTPPFLLPNNANLTFWHWIDAEVDSDPQMAWDGGIVMISSGDGNWAQLYPDGDYSHYIVDNPASPFAPDTPCYSGTHGWEEVTFDLAAYSGVAQLAFRFGSDGAVSQEGWYIDDVSVSGQGYLCGDANNDAAVNIGDAVFIISYAFRDGPAPNPLIAAEANCDGAVNIGDAVYIISYAFRGGPAPCEGCK